MRIVATHGRHLHTFYGLGWRLLALCLAGWRSDMTFLRFLLK
jgi:hypothetical protein